ncbi:MAG TPA: pantoate--beta-alanine ligase [Bacteroidia bacterium]|nr:pantoate--beta-alanine ligase [Bacteroidia bacterium]
MRIFSTIQETKEWLNSIRTEYKSIGFVPTMGALHQGHMSLIKKGKLENDIVIASIFVNPLQFNDKKDLERYPKTINADIEKLKAFNCDALFAPTVEEMYPDGNDKTSFTLDLGMLDKVMEGAHRPGHFQGVCIIVKKLFDIIQPNNAYFGEKDFQQLTIIKTMVRMLKIPINIISVETTRESDGLAMSSRNVLLNAEERKNAPVIYQTLLASRNTNSISVDEIKNWVEKQINKNSYFKLEYFEIVDSTTLTPIYTIKPDIKYRACIAVKVNAIRLIDNIVFN